MKATSFTTLVLVAIFVASCNKNGVVPTPSPPPVHFAPSAPALTLIADTALWQGNGTVTIITDGQKIKDEAGKLITVSKLVLTNLTKDTTLKLTAVNTNEYDSSETTKTITVHVFSQNSTRMEKYGRLIMVENTGCIAGMQNNPSAIWYPGPISCDTIRLFANKGGLLYYGQCDGPPLAGTINANGKWKWANAEETAIDFGTGGVPYIENIIFYSDGFGAWRIDSNGYYDYMRYKSL